MQAQKELKNKIQVTASNMHLTFFNWNKLSTQSLCKPGKAGGRRNLRVLTLFTKLMPNIYQIQ